MVQRKGSRNVKARNAAKAKGGGIPAAAAAGSGAAGVAGDAGTNKSEDPEKLPPAAGATGADENEVSVRGDHTAAGDELTFKAPLDVAELARGVAGAARFFTDSAAGKLGLFDPEEADIMADFVRDNPDAPMEAMFIHLGLQKRYPRTVPSTADLFVLSLFHAACVAAFKFEADRDAEAAVKAPPAPAGNWPGEQALQPSQPAFAPIGFTAR